MLSKQQARSLVVDEINSWPKAMVDDGFVILDEQTIEKPWGWVFAYDSKRHVETGDARFLVAGNAPFIVNRLTGDMRVTGTAFPIEYYIEAYERELTQVR